MKRQSVREISIKLADLTAGKTEDKMSPAIRERRDVLTDAWREAVEDNLNAYEDACAKYIDNKIDRERFRRMYETEIENICRADERSIIFSMMYPEQKSRFHAIWKVYHEWNKREK